MEVSFHLLFGTRDRADKAARLLEAEGYEVGFQPQSDGRSLVVTASRRPAPSAEEIRILRARMVALAHDLGGEFMGHSGAQQVVLPADPLM